MGACTKIQMTLLGGWYGRSSDATLISFTKTGVIELVVVHRICSEYQVIDGKLEKIRSFKI